LEGQEQTVRQSKADKSMKGGKKKKKNQDQPHKGELPFKRSVEEQSDVATVSEPTKALSPFEAWKLRREKEKLGQSLGDGREGKRKRESDAAPTAGPTKSSPWPFKVDAADHCESPLAAYKDLQPLLARLAGRKGTTEERLKIYDPYFCNGRVKIHLASLGFPEVRNVREDFYAAADAGSIPAFDVLVTNPPYTNTAAPCSRSSIFNGTADHVERLLRYSRACGKPCALLVPSYVYMKPFFDTYTRGHEVSFLAPSAGRYTYEAPKLEDVLDAHGHSRSKKTRKTSPFTSMWYLLSPKADGMAWWLDSAPSSAESKALDVRLHSVESLPSELRDEADPLRKSVNWWDKERKDGKKLCKQCGQIHGNCKHTRT